MELRLVLTIAPADYRIVAKRSACLMQLIDGIRWRHFESEANATKTKKIDASDSMPMRKTQMTQLLAVVVRAAANLIVDSPDASFDWHSDSYSHVFYNDVCPDDVIDQQDT